MADTNEALRTTSAPVPMGETPIPQYKNATTGKFEDQTGLNGAADMRMVNDGTDATEATPPAGATGIRGWLSGIYNLLFSGGAKVQLMGRNVVDDGSVKTTMTTALSKDLDSIDVAKMSKGPVIPVFSNINATTTSAEIDCRGFNSLLVHVAITGTWSVIVQGCLTSGGLFVDVYDGATKASTGDQTQNRCVLYRGVPDFVKLFANNTVAGLCTISVQPLNL